MPRVETVPSLPRTPNEQALDDMLEGVEAFAVTWQWGDDTGKKQEDHEMVLARSFESAFEKARNVCAILANESTGSATWWDILSIVRLDYLIWIAQDV